MKARFAALAALAAIVAAPALGETPASSAPAAAPASAPAPQCTRPAIEPFPEIPAVTAKPAQIAAANKAHDAWLSKVNVYTSCLASAYAAIEARAKTAGAAPEVAKYDAIVDALTKAIASAKSAGVEATMGNAQLIRKGKPCPPAPALTPAPAMPPAGAKSGERQAAGAAFATWAGPLYVYAKCVEGQMNQSRAAAGAAVTALQTQQNAIAGENNAVLALVKPYNEKWDAFVTAYKKR